MDDDSTVPTEKELDAFARHLTEYSSSLSDREGRVLWQILLRGMDPVERMKFRRAADLLDPEEEAFLVALDQTDDVP